jgi:hypothetical protein
LHFCSRRNLWSTALKTASCKSSQPRFSVFCLTLGIWKEIIRKYCLELNLSARTQNLYFDFLRILGISFCYNIRFNFCQIKNKKCYYFWQVPLMALYSWKSKKLQLKSRKSNFILKLSIQGVVESCTDTPTTSYWLHVELGKNI